jgi:glycosyltransferase involved in cell wall biosynthesis
MTGVPFSFTSHAKDIFRETVNRDLYKELVDRAAFNITVSDFNRQFILENTPGIDAEKVIRLYNGIDLSYFDQPEDQKQKSRVPHIVSVGRLVPKKGFDILLDALSTWKASAREFRATIIGDGEDREKLHALCGELRRHFREADLSVLACVPDEIGNMDALPTTLLESLALGVPVVSTVLTGVPGIVGDESGVLVPPHDAQALAEGMDAMLRRIDTGEFSPARSRERAQELFDLPTNVGRLATHFQRSVDSNGS